MANRRRVLFHLPECLIWLCRIWGIFTGIVLWGVGTELVVGRHPLGAYLLIVALIVSLSEVIFIVHFWVVYKASDERDVCIRFWSAMTWLDDWKRGLFYLLLAPGCFSQAHQLWLPVISGLMLVVSGVLYCIKTLTNRVAVTDEVSKNETYGRFDEVQEDIDENLPESVDSSTPEEPTVADQEEIMDV